MIQLFSTCLRLYNRNNQDKANQPCHIHKRTRDRQYLIIAYIERYYNERGPYLW